jgi:nicotinamidase-related amidase
MNRSVYSSRRMTIPKNTIGSHVRSVFSRSTDTAIGSATAGLKPETVVYAGRMGELPLPPHVDLDRVGDVWRVDYEARFRDARMWAAEHEIGAATHDERRVCLLVVDAQNTFCTPGFELFVAGRSGTGALDDSSRLCTFLYRNLAAITETVVTLDTHQAFQIFHAPLLVDADRRHPDPYTLVTADDVTSGRWSVDPEAAEILGFDGGRAAEHLRTYVDALAAGDKYDLTIWPFHAMLGGIGHALVSAIEEALFFHATTRRAQTRFEIKGRNPLTEHYSVLGPEVLEGARGEPLGERNVALVRHLLGFDAVIVAGQAKSHCVAWTIEDLLGDAPEIAPRIYLLEDCSSPVVVPDVVDYTDDADRAFASFADSGVHVVRSTDPLATWPGPLRSLAVT